MCVVAEAIEQRGSELFVAEVVFPPAGIASMS
jgi:hypothetical protein